MGYVASSEARAKPVRAINATTGNEAAFAKSAEAFARKQPPSGQHTYVPASGEDYKDGGPTCLTSGQALKSLEPQRNVHFAM
jgi:hypothetical protein